MKTIEKTLIGLLSLACSTASAAELPVYPTTVDSCSEVIAELKTGYFTGTVLETDPNPAELVIASVQLDDLKDKNSQNRVVQSPVQDLFISAACGEVLCSGDRVILRNGWKGQAIGFRAKDKSVMIRFDDLIDRNNRKLLGHVLEDQVIRQ